jgi:hypothetical protein
MKTTDAGPVDKLVVYFSFPTTLIATHQHDVLLFSHSGEPLTQRIPLDQSVVVIFEKKHVDDFRPMRLLFELGKIILPSLYETVCPWLENIYATFTPDSKLLLLLNPNKAPDVTDPALPDM